RPGVLLTIPGPGFVYALAGIAEAWQDSAPLVHIVTARWHGPHPRHHHQALDQAAIIRPMVKAVFGVSEPAQIRDTIRWAFDLAGTGEPGPVIVQLGASAEKPGVISGAPAEATAAARIIWGRIHQARKPMLLLGQGCAGIASLIRSYVERTGTPV